MIVQKHNANKNRHFASFSGYFNVISMILLVGGG